MSKSKDEKTSAQPSALCGRLTNNREDERHDVPLERRHFVSRRRVIRAKLEHRTQLNEIIQCRLTALERRERGDGGSCCRWRCVASVQRLPAGGDRFLIGCRILRLRMRDPIQLGYAQHGVQSEGVCFGVGQPGHAGGGQLGGFLDTSRATLEKDLAGREERKDQSQVSGIEA